MKHQKKFKILLGIFAVIVCILSIVSAPYLTPFLLGGVITQGILGGFSGKVGPVVGGKWKDIDYMRGYVVPANPNSTAQQGVRAKFAQLVATARLILATILQPFWDPFYTNMSGFNAFISQNYSLADVDGKLGSTAKLSAGTLVGVSLLAGAYTTGTGGLVITWDDNTGVGNALGTDTFTGVVLDVSTQIFYNLTSTDTRADQGSAQNIGAGLTVANLILFGFFFRGTGSSLITSDSSSVQVTT